MKFNLYIKHNRILKRITQQKLAELTGLTQQYISRLENDAQIENPTLNIIILIAEALNTCPYLLLSFECDINCNTCDEYKKQI